MTSINIDSLTITYGDNTVISGLDLNIQDGEFFTLLGPSGCGKTTLLRTIAGFITPASGSIKFGDRDFTSIPTHKRNIGMVFQDYALFPDKTVNTNVAYGLKARKVPKSEIPARIEEALDRVGMGGFGDRLPGALSGGQRQRVALARALVIRPSVLLMDEPLSNLDTKLRIQIRESIAELQRELGITTVFVTHDQEEALAMSDRIALFKTGRIEQLGGPTDIYQSPVSSYAADFIGAANVLPITVPDGVSSHEGESVTVTFGTQRLNGVSRSLIVPGDGFAVARPEHLSLAAKDAAVPAGVNAVPGKVLYEQYLGRVRQYRVALSNGEEIHISELADGPGFPAQSDVQVHFPETKTLVMAS